MDAGLQWEVMESEGPGPGARERMEAFNAR